MFHEWGNFYLLIGSAAAALIGLLFVVVTLTGGQDPARAVRGQQIYLTPIVFDFAIVVAVCAGTMAPNVPTLVIGLIVTVCALIGLVNAATIALAIRGRTVEAPHWSDFWCYGFVPAASFLSLLASALAVWVDPTIAPDAIGAALLVLLMISIRNAWDLVTWLAPRREEG